MSATGIGAAVRRKEDRRFITGKGHYTDDVNRPGQTHAYFLRSPHAHAKIRKVDAKAAAAMPGVLAVLTGAELAAEFDALRAEGVALVRGLRPADLERFGQHPEVGRLRVDELLGEWVHHDRNHVRQLLAVTQARVWGQMGNARRFSLEDL